MLLRLPPLNGALRIPPLLSLRRSQLFLNSAVCFSFVACVQHDIVLTCVVGPGHCSRQSSCTHTRSECGGVSACECCFFHRGNTVEICTRTRKHTHALAITHACTRKHTQAHARTRNDTRTHVPSHAHHPNAPRRLSRMHARGNTQTRICAASSAYADAHTIILGR